MSRVMTGHKPKLTGMNMAMGRDATVKAYSGFMLRWDQGVTGVRRAE